jgi:isatin hydrolase
MSSILKNFNLVDLSVTVSEALPSYWPSHMPFAAKVWNYYTELNDNQGFVRSDAPYQTRFWIIDEHCGTHFDAPTHFIPHPNSGLPWASESGTQTGDKVPLEDLMGSAVCIDVSDLSNIEVEAGESPWVTVDHVKAWEQVHGPLCAEVVLFRTGWDRFYIKNDQGHYSTNSLVTKTGPGWPAPNDETVI